MNDLQSLAILSFIITNTQQLYLFLNYNLENNRNNKNIIKKLRSYHEQNRTLESGAC